MENNDKHIDFSKSILGSLKNKNGFKTPDDYFLGLNEEVQTSIFEEKFKTSTNGMKYPKGYFDDLKNQVAYKKETKVIPLFSKKRLIGYAASIAAILAIGLYLYKPSQITTNDDEYLAYQTFSEITALEYFENFTEEEAFELVAFEEDIKEEEIIIVDDQPDYTKQQEEEIQIDPTELLDFDDEEFDLF